MSSDPGSSLDSVLAAFENEFSSERAAVNAALEDCGRRLVPAGPGPVADAMRYALLGSGKRIRGVLTLTAYSAAGGKGNAAPLGALLEIVHAYSLVHDDLPCMDDDDLRRGSPTTHKRWGVEAATVAGVAMVPLAVLAAIDAAEKLRLPPEAAQGIVNELMRASGGGGMIGGQLLDLDAEGRDLNLHELERIHRGKTGDLIAAAARIGGVAAGANERQLSALSAYGHALGLAFQITDDLLDVTATSDRLGKTAGRDAARGKRTYPALLGVAGAAARAARLVDDACAAVESAGLQSGRLTRLAKFTIMREA